MSTPPLQRRSCVDKIRHRSEGEAWKTVNRMKAQGEDTKGLRPYRCEFCRGGWHIGHGER